ncbi:PDDEXK nuclease domain-containing protein [Bacteroidales bacterium OttesenSCG-928-A14]|nr:PDDEXK nuclease domain-containing protein [Bacteroidales bacterium OttesenSCG-928-A14]
MMDTKISLIKRLKHRILASRYEVAKIANAESLMLYYQIGSDIESEIANSSWGDKVLDEISARLQQELPGLRGFSAGNLKKMRIFYNAWKHSNLIGSSLTNQLETEQTEIGSTVSNQFQHPNLRAFFSVSFSHHFDILTKIENENDRLFYIEQTAQNFWSVRHLRTELNNQSHLQVHKMPNNFEATMSDLISNKAIRAFKDQYLLDFVRLEDADEEMDERVLEQEIVLNIKKFLMSLGNDFSFLGNQYRLVVSEEEYFIDLLFFHRALQALVAFELKTGKFKPEYIGKMNFYLSALDDLVRLPHENASIGIILCKEKNDKKVEYSFRDFSKPMGVATYKTTETLPPELQKALPDAETLKKLME